eukprot:TRINITY_DN64639_c0_g1_i1.p1 TRINITY_DN64639_c0_g1~~TRINITY_DN64639_c0_g1_i1.p1  ORF type:complete len:431 (-),score=92.48 TRINITY_DN64639_c0_g1_i1:130-1422(-)
MEPPSSGAGGGTTARQGTRAFLTACLRCGSQLRIIDDLAPAADFAHSFRGGLGESFVVVQACEPEELIERRNGGGGVAEGAQQPRVASIDEVSRVEKILALASGQSETDHPVCGDCLQNVIAEVQRQVEQAADEHRIYQEAHGRLHLELQRLASEDPTESLEEEIARLEAEEKELLKAIQDCDREERELQVELERQSRQEEQLACEEDEFWLGVSEYQLELEESESERLATASAIQYATAELHRLKHTNVLNDMFHISHDGVFGTINRLRLGKLPDQPVPWEEINAAWGQACLLLDALVKKCGVSTQYRLLPRGSYSAIQAGGDVLDLHSGDGGLARFFSDRRFDLAMSAFLACLKDVARFLQPQQQHQRDPASGLPFKIEGDKVSGFSVRVQFNQDERWTKALKFLLSDLKWAIAFVESREFAERAPPL